eukprot:6179816-Pleurochrysis_carterae.AAC.5
MLHCGSLIQIMCNVITGTSWRSSSYRAISLYYLRADSLHDTLCTSYAMITQPGDDRKCATSIAYA